MNTNQLTLEQKQQNIQKAKSKLIQFTLERIIADLNKQQKEKAQ